jgi:autotransporter passenger strand-loop-strand repeat protein
MAINTGATVDLVDTPFSGFSAGTSVTLLVETFSIATGTVLNGGFETVSFSGVSIGATVNAAGIEASSMGGLTSSATIEADGFLKVSLGGTALDVTIANAGSGTVYAGGVASGTTGSGTETGSSERTETRKRCIWVAPTSSTRSGAAERWLCRWVERRAAPLCKYLATRTYLARTMPYFCSAS